MKTCDIAEAIAETIDYKIFNEWKHEGHIDATHDDGLEVNIDGTDYAIDISIRNEGKTNG